MQERNAIDILNNGRWQEYLDRDNMPMDVWLELQKALDSAMEALALQASVKILARQIRSE